MELSGPPQVAKAVRSSCRGKGSRGGWLGYSSLGVSVRAEPSTAQHTRRSGRLLVSFSFKRLQLTPTFVSLCRAAPMFNPTLKVQSIRATDSKAMWLLRLSYKVNMPVAWTVVLGD